MRRTEFMAMQFGLRVVNYPFIEQDIQRLRLLPEFEVVRHKLFGLTIDSERLTQIRRFVVSQFDDMFEIAEKDVSQDGALPEWVAALDGQAGDILDN